MISINYAIWLGFCLIFGFVGGMFGTKGIIAATTAAVIGGTVLCYFKVI